MKSVSDDCEEQEREEIARRRVRSELGANRKVLSEQEEVAATEFLISKLKNTKTNLEFFASMTKSKAK